MIRIDHISFEFAAADEAFAHALYADWDSFCRACFESVAEECLAQYGKSKMLHEIETLNLDLGNIPQEDFYREFPQRLREELLKALPSLHFSATEIHEERTEAARLENLLFYLKNGYPQAEWADEDFSLTAELEWVTAQQSRYTEKIIRFSTGGEHILRRLLWHTGNDAVLLKLYAAALSEQTSGLHEKRRFLVMLLEAKPRIPVRYVHESASDTGLHGMAELLDTASVRQIMTTEAEEHAEVDLPPYWHHLYEWLIRYYPFNGLAVFGSKGDFTRHLHYRLLTFIRKRSHSFYLSKTELTAGFLLEVFGHAHYIEVLNAIYNLQPHYPDGSPVHDSYLNRELYRIFLSLSLLRLPAKEEKEEYASQKEQTPYPADKTFLTDFLKDTQKSRADKRMLLVWLIRERPEILTDWLQTEALKDHAPVHILAEIIDETDISRLLASISFTAVEIVEQIKNYLRSHTPATDRLNRTPESKLSLAIRKAVLFWTGGGHSGISKPESIRQLLHLIYREITGREDADAVEKLSAELHLPEKIRKQYRGNNTAKPDIRKLLAALADTHIPEPAKRRMFALFLEKYGNNYADAILLLHEQGLLNYAVNAISQAIQEEMIRQSVIRIYGEHRAAGLLPLFHRIMAHEPLVAAYLKDNTLGLKARLLLWLAHTDRLQSGEEKTDAASIRSLLTALFGEENMQSVIDRIALETVPQTAFHNMEYGSNTEALSLLLNAGIAKQHASLPDFKKWLRQSENHSKAIQKLLKNRWNTAGEFTRWMEDTAVSPDSKRELLHEIAVEKPRDWIRLLRKQSVESKAVSLLATRMPASLLLQSMAQADFREAALLSQTVEWLQRRISSFPFLSGGSIVFSTVLSQALLLYMQDKETLGGRTLTGKETLHKFLSYLHLAYTGKSSYQDSAEWTDLSVKIAFDMEPGSPQDVPGKEMNEILSRKDTSDTAFSRYIVSMLDKQPEKLLAWLEKGTGASPVARIAAVSDATMLEQWTIFLPTVAGFEHPDAFRRLMTWLIRLAANRALLPDTASVLLSWLSETDWRKQTPEQMENYFFSRLFIKNNITLPVEKLADAALPENTRKILLHRYIRLHPVELLDYIRRSVEQKALPLEKWLEWLETADWLRLAASLSLSRAELLRQMADCLPENYRVEETGLCTALAVCLIHNRAEGLVYNSREEVIRSFVQSIPALQKKAEAEKEEVMRKIKEELKITPAEERLPAAEQEESAGYLLTGSAGLCLISPWFPRLFDMLGYLCEDKKAFKDTASKIRAVFLLQYLACPEEKKYRETELAFNRLLVALPMHIPLPERLPLTDDEKQTAESMLEGVKANWKQMSGTSVAGFRQSFIARSGTLEEQDEKWMLTVNEQAFDILLDTVPWSFRQIRFSWLKKYVEVVWRERQEF